MFNRLVIVRLRAAEKAAREGRLDEAYRLATAPDIREHRRAATILAGLGEQLVERARKHFAEERFAEALNDLAKAEAAGARQEVVAELRSHVRTVADEVARQDRSRRRRVEEARQRVERGSLAAGRDLLAGAESEHVEAQQLAQDIQERQREAADGLVQVQKLLDQDQLPAALERFRKAKSLDPHAPRAIELEAALCDRVVGDARSAFEQGRINRAVDELSALGPVGQSLSARRDLAEVLELARGASQALDEGDFEAARRHILRLRRLSPKVGWVNQAATELQKVDELLTSLYGGPLGERTAESGGAHAPGGLAPEPRLNETVTVKRRGGELEPAKVRPWSAAGVGRPRPSVMLPDRLLVLVDGGGSYLLIRKDRLTIGRAMTRNLPDVPVQSDLAERHAEVSRVDDDYFLFSTRDVEVDGRPTRHHLLRSGNRVVLSSNAKFTFRMPHRQSPSAIMDLGGSTKMPGDVRRVVLFRRTAMIGFGPDAHITCHGAEQNLLLFERGGRLWVRPQRNDRVETEARAVVLAEQIEMSNVSFVVQPFTPMGGGWSV